MTNGNENPPSEYKSEKLPREAHELWFRPTVLDQLTQRAVHATVRVGNRMPGSNDPKGGYVPGSFIQLRIQDESGQLTPHSIVAVVRETTLKPFSGLTDADFTDTPDNLETLEKHYGTITPEKECTIIKFEYLADIDNAPELVKLGTLAPARLPQENPTEFGEGSYTVPLIEHDYPAKTPAMWNAAYKAFNIPEQNIMLVGNPANTRSLLEVLKRDPHYKGGGAGVGFKDESFAHLDELDPMAEAIGSVNFILKTPEGKLKGYNTDGVGYAMSLEAILAKHGETLANKKIVLIGAGGTANSIAFALAEKGATLVILNRTVSKAEALATRINEYFKKEVARAGPDSLINDAVESADVLINVSTIGSAGELEQYSALAPAQLPATPEHIEKNLQSAKELLNSLSKDKIISDIILGKQATPLQGSAAEQGFEVLGGIPMVINQGVEAFWILYKDELEKQGVSKEQVRQVMNAAAT